MIHPWGVVWKRAGRRVLRVLCMHPLISIGSPLAMDWVPCRLNYLFSDRMNLWERTVNTFVVLVELFY